MKKDPPEEEKFPRVQVLLVLSALFVYCASQFSLPGFAFVPKRATVTRSYMLETIPANIVMDETADSTVIREVTVYEWDLGDILTTQSLPPEILERDFEELTYGNFSGQRTFRHRNGDALVWEVQGPIQGMTTAGVCVRGPATVTVTYIHTEERFWYAMVKKLTNWFRRL